MPAKYVPHSHPAPPRVRPVGKLGIVDWREDCASCHNCVKRACIYGLYRDEADTLHKELGYLDYIFQCKGCLSCVQNCTKNILTRVINPEYQRLGDSYYTPDVISSTWFQSETGRIPVSGSGYGGRFAGSGFDSMWTDMSEIVRPTRDGIHGREYINTGVDIGRKLPFLSFSAGKLGSAPPPLVEIPLPVLFDVLPDYWNRGEVNKAIVAAAGKVGTLAVIKDCDFRPAEIPSGSRIIPDLTSADASKFEDDFPLVMIQDGGDTLARIATVKREMGNPIIAIRLPASPIAAERIVDLTRAGAEAIHLTFGPHGLEDAPEPRHMRDVLREVHARLVKEGIRDEVTLIASGGIALAEHVAKAVICGADLVAIDIPLMIAMECRLCGECQQGGYCQIALEEMGYEYGAQRIVNLLAAWHQQLLEVLGAMGIREARRLRGESGRAMFFEDLEREAFGKLFGKRKNVMPIAPRP